MTDDCGVMHRRRRGRGQRPHLAAGTYTMLCLDSELTKRYGSGVAHLTWLEPISKQYVDQWMHCVPYDVVGADPSMAVDSVVDLFVGHWFDVAVSDTTLDRFSNPIQPGEGYTVVRRIVAKLDAAESEPLWQALEREPACSCAECLARFRRFRALDRLLPAGIDLEALLLASPSKLVN